MSSCCPGLWAGLLHGRVGSRTITEEKPLWFASVIKKSLILQPDVC